MIYMPKNHSKEMNVIIIQRKFSKDKVKAVNLVSRLVSEMIMQEMQAHKALLTDCNNVCISGAEST